MTNPNKIIYGGAFPEHPMLGDKSAKHPATQTPFFGFRLAVDGEPQTTFGSSWGTGRVVASVPGVLGANPISSAAFISFRLTREGA